MGVDRTRATRNRLAAIEHVLRDPRATGEARRRAYDRLRDWARRYPDQTSLDLIRRYEETYGAPHVPGYPDTPDERVPIEGRLAASHEEADRLRDEREGRGESPSDPSLLEQAALMGPRIAHPRR